MDYPVLFIAAIIIAFLSSAPVGPVNMAIVQASMNKGFRAGIRVGTGAVLVEMIFAFLASAGLTLIPNEKQVLQWLNILTIPLLFIMGVLLIVKRKQEGTNRKLDTARASDYLIGATLTFSNPMLLAYWLMCAAELRKADVLGSRLSESLTFMLGIGTGVGTFFYLVSFFSAKYRRRMSQVWKSRVSLVMGCFFIAFGIFLLYRLIGMKSAFLQ